MRSTWENFYKTRGRFYLTPHSAIKKVISKFKAYRIKKVLDLGCGSGRHAVTLAREGFKLTGVDYSKTALDLAKKWAKVEKLKIDFKKGNIHKEFPFKDNSFGAVLAIDALQYESTEDLKFSLGEIRRVLKPGGLLFITLPTVVNNPLVTHLVFTEEEIKELISDKFKVLESFFDEEKFLCVLGIKK
jgi:SAM-dependent methyltransferase